MLARRREDARASVKIRDRSVSAILQAVYGASGITKAAEWAVGWSTFPEDEEDGPKEPQRTDLRKFSRFMPIDPGAGGLLDPEEVQRRAAEMRGEQHVG